MLRRIDTTKAEYEVAAARSTALWEAADLAEADMAAATSESAKPVAAAPAASPPSGKRGGRQPGSITESWKRRLAYFYEMDASFDVNEMVARVRAEGQKCMPAEIARVMKDHVRFGYLRERGEGYYEVTQEAANKYNFSRGQKNEGPADAGPSDISTGPEAGARGLATHHSPEGSIPSGSTHPVKNGSVATPADLHDANQRRLVM